MLADPWIARQQPAFGFLSADFSCKVRQTDGLACTCRTRDPFCITQAKRRQCSLANATDREATERIDAAARVVAVAVERQAAPGPSAGRSRTRSECVGGGGVNPPPTDCVVPLTLILGFFTLIHYNHLPAPARALVAAACASKGNPSPPLSHPVILASMCTRTAMAHRPPETRLHPHPRCSAIFV